MTTAITEAMQILLDAVERLEREAQCAKDDASRMAAVNGDLCDELHQTKARVRELEEALLGMDSDDADAVGDAWELYQAEAAAE